jgi:hypothetical protein
MTEAPVRHVLGLSGGRDSAALAVYMRQHHPDLKIEYFFTDTGKLEGFLGRQIERLNPDRDFDFWLTQYKHFLPSPRTRWCTRQLKIRPFEQWLQPALDAGTKIISYVAIRSDEDYREGYTATNPNMTVRLPFRENGIDKDGVLEILEASGVGLPEYYRWRSRSKKSNGSGSWKSIRSSLKTRNYMRRMPSIMAHHSHGARANLWMNWPCRNGYSKSGMTMQSDLSG